MNSCTHNPFDNMNIELITKADLHDLKDQIVNELTSIFGGKSEQREWM
jgi:hypothetical protein